MLSRCGTFLRAIVLAHDCRHCDEVYIAVRPLSHSTMRQQPRERSGLEVQGECWLNIKPCGLTHTLVPQFLANFFNFFDRRVPLFNGVVAGEGVRSRMREILPLAPPA
jgi:hypothetical protein